MKLLNNINENPTANLDLAAIVIAAGNSSRLGQPKQLITYSGKPLLTKAMSLAANICEHYYCVLGYKADEFAAQLKIPDDKIIINSNWQVGMGTSIASGVDYLSNQRSRKPFEAVLVLLCDQYQLTQQDLNCLYSQWTMNKHEIVASQYFDSDNQQWVLGAPAIFPKDYFEQLKVLSKKGARDLLNKHHQTVIAVRLKNASIDLDTLQDLQRMQANSNTDMENNND